MGSKVRCARSAWHPTTPQSSAPWLPSRRLARSPALLVRPTLGGAAHAHAASTHLATTAHALTQATRTPLMSHAGSSIEASATWCLVNLNTVVITVPQGVPSQPLIAPNRVAPDLDNRIQQAPIAQVRSTPHQQRARKITPHGNYSHYLSLL